MSLDHFSFHILVVTFVSLVITILLSFIVIGYLSLAFRELCSSIDSFNINLLNIIRTNRRIISNLRGDPPSYEQIQITEV